MTASTPQDNFPLALQRGVLSEAASFPKADRHVHSLLSASLQSISSWIGKPINMPPKRMADLDEMRKYSHDELYPHIFNQAGFEFTAERTILEAIEDGVCILEMSLDVDFIRFYETGLRGFLDFIKALVASHHETIDFRPEVGLSKNRMPTAQIELALECIDSGLFKSIDLYGNETAQEPEAYCALYHHADSRGLKLKAHVGEFCDANHVQRTLRALGLHEVQHGVAAATSRSLMNTLKNEGIRLNVCPSSNVALSVAQDLARHPIRTLMDNGVRLSINSDDKTIFGKTVTEEYLGLFVAGTLSADELEAIRQDSLSE